VATARAGTVGHPNVERLNKSAKYSSPNSASPCSAQQPIHAALHQSIAHQQQHVIESALPILTPQRHTPIFSAHPTNPVQARRNRATKSAASWVVDRTCRRAASRLADGCSPVLTDA
jgi:hypothetical protein